MKHLLCFFSLTLLGCSTHGEFLTNDKEGWFNRQTLSTQNFVYCRIEPSDYGVRPVCYSSEFAKAAPAKGGIAESKPKDKKIPGPFDLQTQSDVP